MSVAILFSGQGGQHPAMLDFLHDQPAARRLIEIGTEALTLDWRAVLKDPAQLYRNCVAQPLICLMQLARWSALQSMVPRLTGFAGYSVGELGAYACATSMDAVTLARLAHARANLMDQAVAGRSTGMLALRGLGRKSVETACAGRQCWIAIQLNVQEFILGGDAEGLAALNQSLSGQGIEISFLKVGLAAHTPLISSAVVPFLRLLEGTPACAFVTPMVAGIDGTWLTDSKVAVAKLASQIANPIVWDICLDTLYERGCRVFLELGPGRALARMVLERFHQVEARSVEEFHSLDGLSLWLNRHR